MITLIRHAEAQKNITNTHGGKGSKLTQRGELLAKSLCTTLQQNNYTRIIVSPKTQCIETGSIFGIELGLSIQIDNSLMPIDLGVIDGLADEDLKIKFPEIYEQMLRWKAGNLEICELTIPGMTSPSVFYEDGMTFLNTLKNTNENVLVVGTRSTLVLLSNILMSKTIYKNGGYKEVPWKNLGYIGFELINKKYQPIFQDMEYVTNDN